MIKTFSHKGLEKLYRLNSIKGVSQKDIGKLRCILVRLDIANVIADMDLPGFRLHSLKGRFKGYYSVSVNRNWRVIFQFSKGNVYRVDLIDYH